MGLINDLYIGGGLVNIFCNFINSQIVLLILKKFVFKMSFFFNPLRAHAPFISMFPSILKYLLGVLARGALNLHFQNCFQQILHFHIRSFIIPNELFLSLLNYSNHSARKRLFYRK